jgi:predicted GNAT family N-acyltransferase
MANDSWDFVPIQKKHNCAEFDCGNHELNQYLRKYAKQNDKKGIGKTYIAVKPSTAKSIDGYYTISTSTIEFESLSEDTARKLPKYPIPAILIGRLAVDLNCQGEGLGEELLVDALNRIVQISEEVGIYVVRVDAINQRAKQFYLKYEFLPFEDRPLFLFLPMNYSNLLR